MKKIILITVILVLILLTVGYFGVPKKVCVKESGHSSCYKEYYVRPFFYNYLDCNCGIINFSSCSVTPCGIDINLDKENAQIDLLKQLCADMSLDKQVILDYYKKINIGNTNQVTIESICTDGTKLKARL